MKHWNSRLIAVVDVTDVVGRRIRVYRYSEPDQWGNTNYRIMADEQILTLNSSAEIAMTTLSELLLGTDPWNAKKAAPEESCYDPAEVRDINGRTVS